MQMIHFELNGVTVHEVVDERMSLAEFLRERRRLTGTHLGCEHGVCGACTLMLDDCPIRSCITLAPAVNGKKVCSIEGYDDNPLMDLLRAKFKEFHALQCGFCTPGMLAVAYDITRRIPKATRERIRLELSGNICRCTGYVGIVDAIESAVQEWDNGLSVKIGQPD